MSAARVGFRAHFPAARRPPRRHGSPSAPIMLSAPSHQHVRSRPCTAQRAGTTLIRRATCHRIAPPTKIHAGNPRPPIQTP
jgi:hypothetical protein